MNELRNNLESTLTKSVSKEEQRRFLRSSEIGSRCSSLGIINSNSPLVSEDVALNYLASIYVEIYLEELKHEGTKLHDRLQKSRHLLPGFNERTG